MKYMILIIMFFLTINIVCAINTSSSNYKMALTINSGSEESSSNNYKSLNAIGNVITGNTSSSSYKNNIGFINTLNPDNTTPIITLLSSGNQAVSETATVSFYYNVQDNNLYQCYLYWDFSIVQTSYISTNGSYSFTYETQQTSGSNSWFISCRDKHNNVANSSLRILNFKLIDVGGSRGSPLTIVTDDFKFININEFETSYTHRTSNLPLPYEPVNFSVFIYKDLPTYNVTFIYGTLKENLTNKTMLYNDINHSYTTTILGYAPRTLIYYYVEARNNNQYLRTPPQGYDVLVWDNPPTEPEPEQIIPEEQFKINQGIIFFIFLLVCLVVLLLFVIKRKKDKESGGKEE